MRILRFFDVFQTADLSVKAHWVWTKPFQTIKLFTHKHQHDFNTHTKFCSLLIRFSAILARQTHKNCHFLLFLTSRRVISVEAISFLAYNLRLKISSLKSCLNKRAEQTSCCITVFRVDNNKNEILVVRNSSISFSFSQTSCTRLSEKNWKVHCLPLQDWQLVSFRFLGFMGPFFYFFRQSNA